jgi:hypothetical protein
MSNTPHIKSISSSVFTLNICNDSNIQMLNFAELLHFVICIKAKMIAF